MSVEMAHVTYSELRLFLSCVFKSTIVFPINSTISSSLEIFKICEAGFFFFSSSHFGTFLYLFKCLLILLCFSQI